LRFSPFLAMGLVPYFSLSYSNENSTCYLG
jgi:hypothetical protein